MICFDMLVNQIFGNRPTYFGGKIGKISWLSESVYFGLHNFCIDCDESGMNI